MKTLFLCFMIFLPLLLSAQADSVSVSYSEEKVETFEKTTLIDEYEKAFGNNRVVKSSLRIAFNRNASGILANTSAALGQDLFRYLEPVLQFEQKIGIDKSLVASFNTRRNKNDIIWQSNIGLEARWYYEMKKRVEAGKQQPNINGRYISLKAEANPYKYNSKSIYVELLFLYGAPYFMLRPTSTYSLNWGWQFGNNLDFGFSVGLKHGNKATISNENRWINETLSSETGITPFITTNAQTALGLYLPLKRKTTSNYCDFLQCNYEVKQLFKLNINNAFYLDRYAQSVKLDVGYERKIGKSPFSINSNAIINVQNSFWYTPMGYKKDTVLNSSGVVNIRDIPLYSSKMSSNLYYNFGLTEQLRYYIGMKKRVSRGQSANNLSGLYIAASGNYQIGSYRGPDDNQKIISKNAYKQLNIGLGVGYQVQTNRHSFMDVSLSFIRQKMSYEESKQNSFNSMFDFSLKLGLAR